MPTQAQAEDEQPVSDDELTALALAADPDVAVGPGAVSIWAAADADAEPDLLPAWYMPRPLRRTSGRRQRIVIGVVVAAFLLINASGLCSTYGSVG
ncbi:MAG TPA: hypothetical protein VGP53_10605 [Acidimicrobiales bacterium]|nr:hypothetical protein [Acidimicrobiales bacterium]